MSILLPILRRPPLLLIIVFFYVRSVCTSPQFIVGLRGKRTFLRHACARAIASHAVQFPPAPPQPCRAFCVPPQRTPSVLHVVAHVVRDATRWDIYTHWQPIMVQNMVGGMPHLAWLALPYQPYPSCLRRVAMVLPGSMLIRVFC